MKMDPQKKARLEAAGFGFTTVSEWLGLTRAESHRIETGVALRSFLREVRKRAGLTQAQAARMLKTSQSRFSKMENGAPSVSLDLLITSALGLGATFREVGEAIASWHGEPGVDDELGFAVADPAESLPRDEAQAKSNVQTARSVRRTRSAKAA
jgi:transcriptional regulator with XRE-family HTH domain